jgi:hypothetical protein
VSNYGLSWEQGIILTASIDSFYRSTRGPFGLVALHDTIIGFDSVAMNLPHGWHIVMTVITVDSMSPDTLIDSFYVIVREGVNEPPGRTGAGLGATNRLPTIVRGVFMWSATTPSLRARDELLDINGRKVMTLYHGANDVSHLAPGVYFIWSATTPSLPAMSETLHSTYKVILTK